MIADNKSKRALSHVGGRVETAGQQGPAARLADAIGVAAADQAARAHVHGFHSYTARMHPATARRLIDAFCPPGETVLDPFCGSGTVLVEALLSGRGAIGVDASPLAVMLSRVKTRGFTTAEIAAVGSAAESIAAQADARRRAKAGASRNYPRRDRELFEPHMLFELDGLATGIAALPAGSAREALWLVLSSILIKSSRNGGSGRRLAAGFAIRMFARRAAELVRQLRQFSRLHDQACDQAGAQKGAAACRIALGDARRLEVPAQTVGAVISSPPYPGVYDYLDHHADRMRWLGLSDEVLRAKEIGSRREARAIGPEAALDRWRQDYRACLREIGRVLIPGGCAVVLIADSTLGSQLVRAAAVTGELARAAGLQLCASASQRRPHFHRATEASFRSDPRREHALFLRRA